MRTLRVAALLASCFTLSSSFGSTPSSLMGSVTSGDGDGDGTISAEEMQRLIARLVEERSSATGNVTGNETCSKPPPKWVLVAHGLLSAAHHEDNTFTLTDLKSSMMFTEEPTRTAVLISPAALPAMISMLDSLDASPQAVTTIDSGSGVATKALVIEITSVRGYTKDLTRNASRPAYQYTYRPAGNNTSERNLNAMTECLKSETNGCGRM